MHKKLMSDDNKQGENPTPTPEELKQEEDAQQESKREDVRESIIEKHGLDEDSQEELIDSLTDESIEQRKSFGKVVGQKRDWRDKFQEAAKEAEKAKPEDKKEKQADAPNIPEAVSKEIDRRELEGLDSSDNIKDEIRKYAKANEVTVGEATSSKFIQFLQSEEAEQKKVDDASLGGKNRGSTKVDFKEASPEDFDLRTEEGQKGWDKYKEYLKTQE